MSVKLGMPSTWRPSPLFTLVLTLPYSNSFRTLFVKLMRLNPWSTWPYVKLAQPAKFQVSHATLIPYLHRFSNVHCLHMNVPGVEEFPDSLKKLTSLKHLALVAVDLHERIYFPELEQLTLDHLDISKDFSFCSLPKLEILEIHDVDIEVHLDGLPNLV